MPVSVPCVKSEQLPKAPAILPNSELNALGDFDLVIRLQLERLELISHSQTQSALLQACTTPSP